VADVPDLPNGTATVFRVADQHHKETCRATIDDRGYVKTLDSRRQYVPYQWEVLDDD